MWKLCLVVVMFPYEISVMSEGLGFESVFVPFFLPFYLVTFTCYCTCETNKSSSRLSRLRVMDPTPDVNPPRICSTSKCKTVLPSPQPGEKEMKTCEKCREKDKARKARKRAREKEDEEAKKRARADSPIDGNPGDDGSSSGQEETQGRSTNARTLLT